MVSTAGSSPRMRGTPPWSPRSRGRAGIIPAYAGNTGRLQVSVPGAWDHPRVCGEHKTPSRPEGEKWGSSPRMRGTRRRGSVFLTFNGIIPAYAGNTQSNTMRGASVWDHPRVCGEHSASVVSLRGAWGSSPRMRGTRSRLPVSWSVGGDHPRVCGEHVRDLPFVLVHAGSSPRMRGTLPQCRGAQSAHGIIPAYAGNTTCFPL